MYTLKRRFTVKIILSLLTVFLSFASCSSGALTGSTTDTGIVEIITIDEGAIMSAGQKIPMNLYFDPEAADPDEIEVSLKKNTGESIDDVILEYSEDLSPFELTELEDGTYLLTIRIKEKDGTIIGEKEVVFFFTANEYAIQQVTSYPTTIEPDSDVLFFADFLYPEGTDPYIRWSSDEELIAEGSLSEIGNVLQWHVPDEAGIYTLTAEMFPFAPDILNDYTFSAPLSMKGSVFTVNALEPNMIELSYEDQYPVLYHFRGNFRNHGTNKDAIPEIYGDPSLEVRNGIFGYRFDSDSGLVWKENLLHGHNEDEYSVVIQFKGIFDSTETGQPVLTIGDTVSINKEPEGLSFIIGESIYTFPYDKEYAFIGIQISFNDETASIQWFDEGELRQNNVLSADTIEYIASLEEETRFGFGFQGIIDEFGIISGNDNSESIDQFAQAMEIKYGKDLILAEGFDTGLDNLQEQISLDGTYSIDIETSTIELGDDGIITASGIEITANGIEIVFEAEENENTSVILDIAGASQEILLEYSEGYYHGQFTLENADEADNSSVFIESEQASFSIHGPVSIKSLLIKNIRNEAISNEIVSPFFISRLASL